MSDTRQALDEAFRTVFPPPNAHLGIDVPALEAHNQIVRRFRRFLDAEAWTDAAMMLVQGPAEYPDSKTFLIDCAMQTSVHSQPVAYVWSKRGKHMGKGKTPALALAQACLKARENGDG